MDMSSDKMPEFDFRSAEIAILSPATNWEIPDSIPERLHKIIQLTATGQYLECLNISCRQVIPFQFNSWKDIEDLSQNVTNYLECENDAEKFQRAVEVFCCAVSCLQMFVATNWARLAGVDLQSIFPSVDIKQINEKILALLEVDGEALYPLVEDPILLYIARLLQDPHLHQHCKTAPWWYMRCIGIHQQLLEERSPTLQSNTLQVHEKLLDDDFFKIDEHRSLLIQLHLEAGQLKLHYYQYNDAEKHFQTATELAGLSCTFDGALGVRTRFQTKAVAQLRVNIKRTRSNELQSKCPVMTAVDFPKALSLNDDTILDSVKFHDGEDNSRPALTPEEHAIILTMCTNMQKTSPSHKLRDEEILCVLEFLIADPKSWIVQSEALTIRSFLQAPKSRTVERSMMQMESLAKKDSEKSLSCNGNDAVIKRLSLIYSVWPNPRWGLEKQLARVFESLGVLSSALDIYKRLHMWEDAIKCFIRTSRGSEAEVMIRGQLAIKETSNLYCHLGDVLQDPELYEKAWEVSKHRNARSMRCLGAFKLSRKLHQEAIVCFEKSLKINHLQVGVWFSVGIAAMACGDYEKAAKSFQKCVSLNWDNFQAWGNLSTAFVRCNKKNQAFRALQEAIKCEFEKWQLWENLLFISTDIGQFGEAIRAYNRLLDLKDKYLDIPVLALLVRAVTESMLDAQEQPAAKLRPRLQELFGRLTSKTTSNWEVWSLYAVLLGNGTSGDKELDEKAFHMLQKALRSGLQQPSWEKDFKKARKITNLALDFSEACLLCEKQNSMTKDQAKASLTTTKLSVNSVVAKLKMQVKQLMNEETKQQFMELQNELEEKLNCLNNCLQEYT